LLICERPQGVTHLARRLEQLDCNCSSAHDTGEVSSLLEDHSFRLVLSTRPVTEGSLLMIYVTSVGDRGFPASQERYRGKCQRDRVPETGMGLAVAKAIIEAHGGKIEATSEPGRGATFTRSLPRDSSARDDFESASCTWKGFIGEARTEKVTHISKTFRTWRPMSFKLYVLCQNHLLGKQTFYE
jgi:histidine kinase/DNA gyrase B/HSP90-like ATPase